MNTQVGNPQATRALHVALFEMSDGVDLAASVQRYAQQGADVSAPDRDTGLTPLFIAAWKGKHHALKALLDAGAVDRIAPKFKRTALHASAESPERGATEALRLLLEAGGNARVKDEQNWRPLHFAALGGHAERCRLLVNAGAKVTDKTVDGKAPIDVAIGLALPFMRNAERTQYAEKIWNSIQNEFNASSQPRMAAVSHPRSRM